MFILLLACIEAPDHDGIAIGNPPSVAARLAPVDGAQVTTARMHVSEVTAGCGAQLEMVTDVGAVDLLAENALPVPSSDACVMSIGASSALELSFLRDDGAQIQGAIDVGTLSLMAEEPVALTGSWVFELGTPGWLGEGMLDGPSPLAPGSEAYGLIVAALRSGSGLFADLDEDGQLSASERADGAWLQASAADDVIGTGDGDDGEDTDGDGDDTACPYGEDDDEH